MVQKPASPSIDLTRLTLGKAALGFDPAPVFKGFGSKPDADRAPKKPSGETTPKGGSDV